MKVEQMTNRNVKACHPEDSLNQAAQLLWDHSCGGLVVVDAHSRPIGFLTDRDICMAAYTRGKLLQDLTVEGAMASRIVCCHLDDELSDAMGVMRERHVRRLPVIDREGKLAGILSLDDLAYEAGRPTARRGELSTARTGRRGLHRDLSRTDSGTRRKERARNRASPLATSVARPGEGVARLGRIYVRSRIPEEAMHRGAGGRIDPVVRHPLDGDGRERAARGAGGTRTAHPAP